MANFAVTPTDTTFTVQVGENTLAAANSATAAAASAAAAEGFADDASDFRDLAEIAALTLDNVYPDTATGLAAVSEGGYFWTSNPLTLWRKVSGSAVEQDAPATRAALAASTGAALIGSTLGVTLQAVLDAMPPTALGLNANGVIGSPSTFGVYTPSGTNDGSALSTKINAAIAGRRGSITIPSGQYYIDADLPMGDADDFLSGSIDLRHFKLSGAGMTSDWPFSSTTARTQGTALLLAPGRNITFGGQSANDSRLGYRIEDMTIAGRTDGTALVSDVGISPFNAHFGGLKNVRIMNLHLSAPTNPDTWAAAFIATFTSDTSNVWLNGQQRSQSSWSDASKDINALYFGGGLKLDTFPSGSGELARRMNVTGFDRGLKLGHTTAEWDDLDSGDRNSLVITAPDLQIQYCNEGMFLGRGIFSAKFTDTYLEFTTKHHVKVSDGAGIVAFNGGTSTAPTRSQTSGGTKHARDGIFVIGDPVQARNTWGVVAFNGFYFGNTTQVGIQCWAGEDTGEIILDGCGAQSNGGALIGIDVTDVADGYPDILVKNYTGPFAGFSNYTVNRLISVMTFATDNSQHTFVGDGRQYARLENCPGFEQEIPITHALDFTKRKYPPRQAAINTTSGAYSFTLGGAAEGGKDMWMRKQFAANRIEVVLPQSIVVTDGTGAVYTGPSGGATYHFLSGATGLTHWVPLGGGRWKTTATLTLVS